MPTQRELVLDHLRRGESITQFQALRDYGIQRLAARVHELRRAGHPVQDRTIEVHRAHGGTARVSEYYFEDRRFGDLALHERFRTEGDVWLKTTAFRAACESSGRRGFRDFDPQTIVQPIRDGK
jgi:hypothetical protein